MKYLILLVLVTGCTTVRYKDDHSEFEGSSYFTFQAVDSLSVILNGEKRTLKLQGATNDQVQALERVAGAVTEAAINSIK